MRIVVVLACIAAPLFWWKGGWQSALFVFVGAAISASGLWEWRRLMSAIGVRMDLEGKEGKKPSMAPILIGFFLRLGLTLVVLYVTLKYLEGSALALAAGLAMGVAALTIEGVRMLRAGTI